MQFTKTRTVMGELIQGDYYGYDTSILIDLLLAIDPDVQLMGTDESTQLSFMVICKSEHEDAIMAVVKEHGSEASVAARLKAKDVAEYNAPILAKLEELDKKSIRALRDNDTTWIKKYKDDADAERAKLKK